MKILLNKKNIGLLNAFKLSTNNIRFFSSTILTNYNSNNNNSINNNNFPILFTMTTSELNNKKNLYASITSIPYCPNNELLNSLIINNLDIDVIFIITGRNDINHVDNIMDKRYIYYVNLNDFINQLISIRDNKTFDFYKNIFHKGLFISIDISWDQFVLALKNNNFYISGGMSTKRHIISSTQRKLCKILDYLGISDDFTLYSYHNNQRLLVKGDSGSKKISNFCDIGKRNFSTYLRNFSSKSTNKQAINLNKLLNISQKLQKTNLDYNVACNKLIDILNIFNKYLSFSKIFNLFHYCTLLSLINKNLSIDQIKNIYDVQVKIFNNNEEKYEFLCKLIDAYISYAAKQKFIVDDKDMDQIESILIEINYINEQPILSDSLNKISRQTIFFEHSPIFYEVKDLLSNIGKKTNEEIQYEIEEFLHSSWIDSINTKINDAVKKGSVLSEGFKLLHKHVIEFQDYLDKIRNDITNIKEKKNDPDFDFSFKPLFELNKIIISAVVFNLIIPLLYITNGISRNELLMKIGDKLFHMWALNLYDKKYLEKKIKNKCFYIKDRPSFKEFKQNLNISLIHKGNLGEKILQEILDMGTIIESRIEPLKNSKKVELRIIPTELSLKLFEKSFELIGFKLPMICPPVTWSENTDGGFLLNNNLHFDDLIHQGFSNVTPTTIYEKLKNNIFGQINYMNNIPFKINKDVLNFIMEKGVEMGLILGSLHKKTLEMNALLTREEKKIFEAQLSLKDKQDMLTHNSRYYQERNILGIAQLFKDVDKFYFPLFFDWRGRIYTDTSYLNYQSLSLAKALLLFADGEEMIEKNKFEEMDSYKFIEPKISSEGNKSHYWLNVYGANCFGKGAKNLDKIKFGEYPFKSDLDKLSFNDRVDWINKHHNDIMSLNIDFWTKADEPLLFLAFCFEYRKINIFSLSYKTCLPIQLDATCNGLQHLSTMSANLNLAKLVNLLPNTEDQTPFDLYSVALNEINKKIKNIINKGSSYKNLKYLNLDRAIVKRSIMTIPYNVTKHGIVDQLKEFFNKEYINEEYLYIPKDIKYGTKYINGKDLYKLAEIIYNTLYETHPELEQVVNYFKDMVNLMTELELPIVWITPAGLKIKQKYAKKQSSRIRSGSFKGASYNILIPTDKIDKISQQGAFMPNLIHSMDGSTITLLVKKLIVLGIKNIYTIHDCFATTANNITIINELVRESFCEIYANEQFLFDLHKFFIEYISGNFNILYNNEFLMGKDLISKDKALEGGFYVYNSGKNIPIPKLPKTGDFTNLKNNIEKAIYLIN